LRHRAAVKYKRRQMNKLEIYDNAKELAWAAAMRFASLAEQAVLERGRFTVALSGGSTPKAMFSILAGKPFADALPWQKIHFFWGDERCVPPEHPDSNYRMANETLLSKVAAPRENISRILAEDEDHDRAAANYSETIQQFFNPVATAPGTASWPRFNLVFLGMGPDGHTASLFPGTMALQVEDRIAVANFVEKFQTYRITLTAKAINNAENVIFLIAGEDKAVALKEVLEGERQPETYPSQLIHPVNGELLWMLDETAAAELTAQD
jgi:6-phosphogluconolactonase